LHQTQSYRCDFVAGNDDSNSLNIIWSELSNLDMKCDKAAQHIPSDFRAQIQGRLVSTGSI
jgi:hypothetical protein